MADSRLAPLSLARRPESLTQAVYDAIREAIVSRKLAPGSRVTETTLATQLGVSKTPVREALLKLREIGLLEPEGLRGVRVVRASRQSVHFAYEVREALEVFNAQVAAGRATKTESDRIVDAAAQCLAAAEAGDLDGIRTWDHRFHLAVSEAVGNPRLSSMVEDTFALIGTLRRRDVPYAAGSMESARAHVRVADAIKRGAPAEAAAAMRAHIHQVEAYVLASMAEEEMPDAPDVAAAPVADRPALA